MPFDLGGGLSAMGKSISDQAGAYGLAEQKMELQNQMEVLANQLAEGRQTRVAGVEHGFRQQEAKDRMDFDTKRDDQNHAQRMDEIKEGHNFRLDEISAQSKAQIKEAWATHGLNANELSTVETDDATGKRYGITKLGKKIDLGITGPNAADEKLMARAEKFGATKKTVTDENNNKNTEEEIDPEKAADFLRRQGRDDLAAGYAAAKPKSAPIIPAGLPPGSKFNAYRKQWRDPDGKLYDASGKPATGSSPNATGGLINTPVSGP